MAKPQPGDLVRITFTAVVDSDQSVFESTDERIARAAGIYSPNISYGPRLVIFGRGFMIPGLEEGISKLEPGQSAKIHIPAEFGFGPRLRDLVRVMSEKMLWKAGLQPKVGMLLNIDGVQARVISVSSGRVVVDFNHPLAGADLTYHLSLLEVINDPKEKVKALGEAFNTSLRIEQKDGKNIVWVPKSLEQSRARSLASQLSASLSNWAEIKLEN
jgi:FKBP-type peptidyl-prolyl cis-trans isomerase SlyD